MNLVSKTREILIILNKRRDFSNNDSIPIVILRLSLSLPKEAQIDKNDTTIIYKKSIQFQLQSIIFIL
jgi:hypothetical protein